MSKAKQIEDFPDYYVTDTGNVFSRRNKLGRFRKLEPSKNMINDYLFVRLGREKKKNIYIG